MSGEPATPRLRRVAVVTDSTSSLPAGLAAARGIGVVPLSVTVGERSRPEGAEVSAAEVAEALRSSIPVTTSRPSPEAFLQVWRAATAAGSESVVSVHLSAEMSGTVETALMASRTAAVPVEVVDSRSLAMGLGFAVLAAADAADAGADVHAVARAARERAGATRSFFCVDTLEHLRRGGRIGAAQAFLGSALAVKPLLHLVDGRIAPLEKVRTRSRAVSRLEDVAAAAADEIGGAIALAVQHLDDPGRALSLADRLAARVPALDSPVVVGEVGAVVGAHVGPGALGVVVAPA